MPFSDLEIAEAFAESTGFTPDAKWAKFAQIDAVTSDDGGTGKRGFVGIGVGSLDSIGADFRDMSASDRYSLRQLDSLSKLAPKEARRIMRDYARSQIHNQRLGRKVPVKLLWEHLLLPKSSAMFLRLMARAVYRQNNNRKRIETIRRLSPEQVVMMRNKYAAGSESFNTLAAEFGISNAAVSQIIYGTTYRDVGGYTRKPFAARKGAGQ